ncbi:MAG TPA: NAD(P)-dependent oxidoreductase [Bacillales bacterium]|nr:NAD(P)-dependent oxidoreductase [Bacillales bacterium]
MDTIGVVGCGAMGAGMVENLLRNGFEVFIYDPDEGKMKTLEREGAVPGENVQSVAKEVKFLLTSLPRTDILMDVLYGEKGAFNAMESGTYVLDMGTTDVEATRQAYEKAREKGIAYFDCPVSGGPEGSRNGGLTIMVGGREEAFPQIRQVLEAIGKQIHYIGESGAGQIVKLCNNMVVAGITVLLSEAFLTGSKAGVAPRKIAEVMQAGSAGTRVMDVFGGNLLAETYENVLFMLNHMSKDIDLYLKLAKQCGGAHFISDGVDELYRLAKMNGKGELDSTAVAEVLRV